jgi:HlyD family secretion protein
MDRKIKNRRWSVRNILLLSGSVVGTIFLFYGFLSEKQAKLVDRGSLIIAAVIRSEFREYIPVEGNVLPVKTIYIDAVEGGRVEEKFVDDGAVVSPDQPLLRLTNTDLQLDLLNRETMVFDLINNLQNTRNQLEQNRVNRQNQLADTEYSLQEAERVHSSNQKLYEDKMISSQEFSQSLNQLQYQKKKKVLIERALLQDSVSAMEQIRQMQQSLQRMKMNLDIMKQKTRDLMVRSPLHGRITSFSAEVGESKTRGQNLAQLDVLDGFKVRAGIDEHYITRIFTGQKGIFDIDGKSYQLSVLKIFPQVTNNRFQVDMVFEGEAPEDLKNGQTLQIKLQLGGASSALQLPRGAFYQLSGGSYVFVIDENNIAQKRNIKLGRQNPDYYEVLEGLKEGEAVIVSGYGNFGDAMQLKISNE